MEDKIKLFCVTHKPVSNIPPDRTLIGVGEKRTETGAAVTDYTGDNISRKNANYCELTALYWIWKNQTCEYVGLEHYRRLFYPRRLFSEYPLTKDEIYGIVKSGSVVLPVPMRLPCSTYEHYRIYHEIDDLALCGKIVKEKYPAYYGDFERVMRRHWFYTANMFVMPKVLMDEYCLWLFDILREAEERIDVSVKDPYQARVFGFLSERLFNAWILHKGLKVYHADLFDAGPVGARKKIWIAKENKEAYVKLLVKRILHMV